MTAQLISPAAQTRVSILHVNVLLRPSCWELTVLAELLPAALNALWHTVGAWHTLHPVPVQPEGHAHAEPETFPNEDEDAAASERCAA
jgi:hypothetical protein